MFNKIILGQVRHDKNIVYGARSIMKQSQYGSWPRRTEDWDIYSKTPRSSAKKLGTRLERKEPGKQVNIKPAQHQGTYHVYYRHKGVADFTEQPKTIRYKTISGIRYSLMEDEIKRKSKSLKYKKYAFRHEKDQRDINHIETSQLFSKFRHL